MLATTHLAARRLLGGSSGSLQHALRAQGAQAGGRPVFFDMLHSNNAARIRLWMQLKRQGGMADLIETKMIQYSDLQTAEYARVNPLRKVPALVRTDGTTVFESSVILNYLEDKYGAEGRPFLPPTAEGRQQVDLLCRVHDLYIASPNCTAPGFSHSQGAMYLSHGWHGAARGMDLATRACKVREIWRQLSWLEGQVAAAGGPFIAGAELSLADLTWFPTCVFMDFMLPRVFGWPRIFEEAAGGFRPLPQLARWYTGLKAQKAFAEVYSDIWGYWVEMEQAGQFAPILTELASEEARALKFSYGRPQRAALNYQEPPPPGKRTGRYIDQPDRGDVVDEHVAKEVWMHDGRELVEATLEKTGFELRSWPTRCPDFQDDAKVEETYYGEMIELIKAASGAKRVFIFDHTVRESGLTNLNASAGSSAAPVPRVHCDYTAEGAPRRLLQLGRDGIFSRVRGRELTEQEVAELAAGRFAFINVWRSIDKEHPVMQQPLAVCDERSVPEADRFKYELLFPDRTGENYSLRHSEEHRWYYFPRMRQEECLVFKVYDKKEDGPRFVFHTAFSDPGTPADAPPRRSIEIRSIAFFDAPV